MVRWLHSKANGYLARTIASSMAARWSGPAANPRCVSCTERSSSCFRRSTPSCEPKHQSASGVLQFRITQELGWIAHGGGNGGRRRDRSRGWERPAETGNAPRLQVEAGGSGRGLRLRWRGGEPAEGSSGERHCFDFSIPWCEWMNDGAWAAWRNLADRFAVALASRAFITVHFTFDGLNADLDSGRGASHFAGIFGPGPCLGRQGEVARQW